MAANEYEPNRAMRRCRTKRERAILVEGFDPPVKLHVVTTFGRILQLQSDLAGMPEDAGAKAQVDMMLDFFDEAMKRWDGVEDEDGKPLPYSRQAFLDLDMEDCKAIMDAVQNMGEAGSGDPLAETATPDTSEEPPAS